MKSLSRSDTANILTEASVTYFASKGLSLHTEVGLKDGGGLRADVVALSTKGKIVIAEIKSCWQDFAKDTKWQKYLPFCNQFYFCIPQFLYESDKGQLIEDVCKQHKVGLMILEHEYQVGHIRIISNASKSQVSANYRRWLITKLAWRAGISVANCKPKSHGVDTTELKTRFKQSMPEKEFLALDSFSQRRYLKLYPHSKHKSLLKKVPTRIRQARVTRRHDLRANPKN